MGIWIKGPLMPLRVWNVGCIYWCIHLDTKGFFFSQWIFIGLNWNPFELTPREDNQYLTQDHHEGERSGWSQKYRGKEWEEANEWTRSPMEPHSSLLFDAPCSPDTRPRPVLACVEPSSIYGCSYNSGFWIYFIFLCFSNLPSIPYTPWSQVFLLCGPRLPLSFFLWGGLFIPWGGGVFLFLPSCPPLASEAFCS